MKSYAQMTLEEARHAVDDIIARLYIRELRKHIAKLQTVAESGDEDAAEAAQLVIKAKQAIEGLRRGL